MRSIEEFRKYVYSSADIIVRKKKRKQRIFVKCTSALCLFACITGIAVYRIVPSLGINFKSTSGGHSNECFAADGLLYTSNGSTPDAQFALGTEKADCCVADERGKLKYAAEAISEEDIDTCTFGTEVASLHSTAHFAVFTSAEDISEQEKYDMPDFDNYALLLISVLGYDKSDISLEKIDYDNETVTVTIIINGIPDNDEDLSSSFHVLLDKKLYSDQEINLFIKTEN